MFLNTRYPSYLCVEPLGRVMRDFGVHVLGVNALRGYELTQ